MFASFIIIILLNIRFISINDSLASIPILLNTLNIIFINVIAEELIFRYLLKRIIYFFSTIKGFRVYKEMRYILLSSILFSIAHFLNGEYKEQKFIYFLIFFIAGVYFSSIYVMENNIYTVICTHFLNNVLSTFLFRSHNDALTANCSYYVLNYNSNAFRIFVRVLFELFLSFLLYFYYKARTEQRAKN